MSIQFTYEVVAVNNATQTMTVKYTAVNYPDINVELSYPVVPDTVQLLAHASAPLNQWRALTNQLNLPVVGEKGNGVEVNIVPVNLTPL
tara:strand:+ start:44 stop:310 length:267 start_codon:yes stop_codon:yes gene_type:complete